MKNEQRKGERKRKGKEGKYNMKIKDEENVQMESIK